MKSAFISLLSAICFFSFSPPAAKVQSYSDSLSHVDSPNQMISTDALPAFKKLDTIIPFSGVWVNAVYLQRIRDNRSPRLSQNVAESCIIFPGRTLQVTRMVGGFHDGAADMVVLKNGDRYQFYSADLTLFLKDIQPVSDSQLRIGDQSFIRLQHPDTTLTDWGILEECLFQGKYIDQLGRAVVFAANGHVSGLDSFSYYVPQIDYTEMNEPVDHIQLGRSSLQMDDFGFRFDKDRLIIYNLNCLHYDTEAKQCDSAALGQRLYTLVRAEE